MDIGVGSASISVGTCFCIVFRFFNIFLFHDLLAFDHAVPAVRACLLALLTSGTAAGTVFVIFDPCADDPLTGGRGGSGRIAKTCSFGNPPDKLSDQQDGQYNEEK